MNRVSVFGLGKLGACMVATMASRGMEVMGVDVIRRNVELVGAGRAPVTEPGLEAMLAANRQRVRTTLNPQEAVHESDVSFIIVPTPSDANGRFSLEHIVRVVQEVGTALKKKSGYHLTVITSTVLPGSMEHGLLPVLEKSSGKQCGKDFGFCYNPEFIALGSVIQDLLNPDFVLIGESDDQAGARLEKWYAGYCTNHAPIRRMNWVNAELTKISVNSFVTTKITFANTLANICEELPGADIDVVSAALGSDSRIGRKYLTGALGYGGPCFPRDNRGLAFLAGTVESPAGLAGATDRMNESLLRRRVERIHALVPADQSVAVLGLAYKPDTNVVEESQGVALAQTLIDRGNAVTVFDPLAMNNARAVLNDRAHYAASLAEALAKADAVVIANPSKEFRQLSAADFPKRRAKTVVFDCWRVVNADVRQCAWIDYRPLGIGRSTPDAAARLAALWKWQ